MSDDVQPDEHQTADEPPDHEPAPPPPRRPPAGESPVRPGTYSDKAMAMELGRLMGVNPRLLVSPERKPARPDPPDYTIEPSDADLAAIADLADIGGIADRPGAGADDAEATSDADDGTTGQPAGS